MGFTADIYRIAAIEHVAVAQDLYSARRYVLAHYIGGLAAECMLRAYRFRYDRTLDVRHDLHELAKTGRFYDIIPQNEHAKVDSAFGVLAAQWLNNHRFRSEACMRSFLRERTLNRRIRGDFLKENTRRVVNAALAIVNLGAAEWHRKSN